MRSWTSLVGSTGVGAALLLGACSLALRVDEPQCETDQDCRDRGPAFADAICVDKLCQPSNGTGGAGGGDSRWACVGHVEYPDPNPAVLHQYQVRIVELNSQEPPSDMVVMLCPLLDVDCTTPVAGPLAFDSTGLIDLQLEEGFEGYMDITSSTTVPSLLYFAKPIFEDYLDPEPVQILTPGSLNGIAAVGGYTLDPARGHVLVLAVDCNDKTAAGVRLESNKDEDDAVVGFYMIGGLPDPDATCTDSDGNAGFVNLPPGFVSITGYVQATDLLIGLSAFQIRAGTISYVNLSPSPLS